MPIASQHYLVKICDTKHLDATFFSRLPRDGSKFIFLKEKKKKLIIVLLLDTVMTLAIPLEMLILVIHEHVSHKSTQP